MDIDDFKSPEVGIAAAATAVALSPAARRFLRQGAVYGVTGVILAGETLLAAGRGVTRGFRAMADSADGAEITTSPQPRTKAAAKKKRARRKSNGKQ